MSKRKPPPLGAQQGLFDSVVSDQILTDSLVHDVSHEISVPSTPKAEKAKVDWRVAAETWVIAHPEGWTLFCRLMLEEIQRCRVYGTRFSVRDMIWPKMRWENPIPGTPLAAVIKYKLPNGLSPYFVRFFQDLHPEIDLTPFINMGRIRC